MANDQKERCNGEQKEGVQGAACKVNQNQQTQEFDNEFAADSWMGAVLSPEMINANRSADKDSSGTASYDPQTYTESYRGESGLNQTTSAGVNESQASAYQTGSTEDHRSEQAATSNLDAGAYYGEDKTASTKYETAAEIAPPATPRAESRNNNNTTSRSPGSQSDRQEAATGLGWTGLGLSILSLFFLPYLLGPVSMVIGYLAFRRNARTLGTWAMIIGAVAILGALIIHPYYVAR